MVYHDASSTEISPLRMVRGRRISRRGFTLVEMLVALAMLALGVSGGFYAFCTINTHAMANRLFSEAQAVAEQQMDAILTKGPFDPTQTPPKIPAILTSGTTAQSGVLVYVDPITNQVVVMGTMTTTITDPGLTQTINGVTTNLNVRQAKVDVSYTYRNTTYHVIMNTTRTADQ